MEVNFWLSPSTEQHQNPCSGPQLCTRIWVCTMIDLLTLSVPIVTNIDFLPMISLHCQETRWWELIKWSPKRKCFDLLSNSLNSFLTTYIEISLENLYVDSGAWRVKNAIVNLPLRLNGNTKSISGNLLRLLGAPNKDTNTDLQTLHVLTGVRLCLWCRQCCRVRKWLDCSGQNKVIVLMGLLYVGVPLFSGLSQVAWAIPLIP